MTTSTGRTLFLCTILLSGCSGAVHHADEPTLASQARPISESAPAHGELASACDRTVWSFAPTTAGLYRFEARSAVPLSIRLFSMSPDLYLDTGRTEADAASVEASLEPGESYAITLEGTDCRPTSYDITVALSPADVSTYRRDAL